MSCPPVITVKVPVDSVTSVFGRTGAVIALSGDYNTSLVTEGSNLYYTSERVDDRVAALIQSTSSIIWTYNDFANTLSGAVSLSSFSTTNLTEGSNLYYTDERVDDRVSSLIRDTASITWSYNDSIGQFTATVASIAAFTTTNLAEGTNLYYTEERVDDRVADLLQDSSSIRWTYDDAGNSISGTVELSSYNTSDLAEGTNLYFTAVRVPPAIVGQEISPSNVRPSGNVVFNDRTKGVVLKSPGGSYFLISVDDSGVLFTSPYTP
jgi:hypothetical protein